MKYTITQSRLLYVLHIDDREHRGFIKIGEVFVDNDVADNPVVQQLRNAVVDSLNSRSYMKGVKYTIDHVECTTYEQQTKCYKADDVYRTLRKMGVKSKAFKKINGEDADIWFVPNDLFKPLADVMEAIRKIKAGNGAGYGAIKFRPEQEKAISDTVKQFQKPNGKTYLWNAKMRFGKTLSSLEVAKRCEYKSTLIITHRPVVDKGWNEDFNKIFGNDERYAYGRRMMDDNDSTGDFYSLTKDVDAGKKRLVFFVSMQYLRLSQFVGGKERHLDPLKKAIMQYDWDFVMVDEAHEGIEAAAGVRVMDKLKKEKTRILSLSGTPFNLLDKYEGGEIYTWDYVMEQKSKQDWDDLHYGDPNPYADLPRMQILTFTLRKMVRDMAIENNEIFKFHEFFRVWTEDDRKVIKNMANAETNAIRKAELEQQLNDIKVDSFVHEAEVREFIKKLRTNSDTSQYPFSTDEFRDKFRHTLWLLPGVKEAAAFECMLREDKVFGKPGMFHIINVAGDGNIEDKDGSALAEVEDNIRGYDPSKDENKERAKKKKAVLAKKRTITLSCGKLTTGVSVPEWTAVLCMKGSENTPAANYMQTIFRVQTHATLNGRQKSDCYVFDFAPDRALTAVAETAKMAVYAQGEGKEKQLKLEQKKEEEHLAAFIKLCPVLSMDEGEMGKHFSANQIFEKLSNVYIERAVRSGYADNSLYNQNTLLNLTPEQEKALGDVSDLLGSMPSSWKPEKININKNGLGDATGAEQIKYIYYLSSKNEIPATPVASDEWDDNGCPRTNDEGWSDIMNLPGQMFPYLFVSNSRCINGEWTSFSKPVLWKEWTEKEKNTDEAKKKRDEENKEKRARMSVLRGVSIRIPLLVYGAEINDEAGEEITIDNFASDEIVDDASWEEFMPKGFTKETFNILKDCFDRSIFTGAAKRIRQMVKEADTLNTEDRINKIATIFSYFHNPDKETVLTPWRVVNMHMSDCLGGWCFFNEEFDGNYTVENEYGENINAARFVDRGQVTKDVFGDYNARILEINSKTGLYPLYMAYSIFKNVKEPEWRKIKLTEERGQSRDAEQYNHQAGNDLLIWRDVLQDNIFVVCRTKMAVSITKRTLAGSRKDIRMNVKCYEREMSVNDLVRAGVLKEHLTINKKGVYLYDKKPEVAAKKLYENGDLLRNDVKIVGEDDEEESSKIKVFYEGKEQVEVASLVKSGKLRIRLKKEGTDYLYDGRKSVECDMVNVLRANPELFQKDIVQGKDFWSVYNSIPTSKNEDINNMKFSAIVGNPPYQMMTIGHGAQATAIYPQFIEAGRKLKPNFLSMISPSRWMNKMGIGIDAKWVDSMLESNCFVKICDYLDGSECFPGVEIKGGVNYFLYQPEYNGKCNYQLHQKGVTSDKLIELNNSFGVVIRDIRAVEIIDKVNSIENGNLDKDNFSNLVGPLHFFDNDQFLGTNWNDYSPFPSDENNIKCYVNKQMDSTGCGWTNINCVPRNKESIPLHKVFMPKAGGSGNDPIVIGTPFYGEPNSVCSFTYLCIGYSPELHNFNEKQCKNIISYMKTRFFRYMVSIKKKTQDCPRGVFQFVPMQDFNKSWTDAELYEKYKLSIDEVNYIESLINPMQ